MNLTETYLKQFIVRSFKLHAGTWNELFCVRSYEWDDDTWAFTQEDFNCVEISSNYVRLKLKEAGAETLKTNKDEELFLFDSYEKAKIATEVMNDIWFDFYKNLCQPITIISKYFQERGEAI